MFINNKVLNIPPFISVHWNQVEFLTTEANQLIVQLLSGKSIAVPDLAPETLQLAFESHASFLDLDKSVHNLSPSSHPNLSSLLGSSDVKISFSTLDPNGIGLPLQHLEELREAPNLPPEVLEKVKTVSKLVPYEDLINSPKPLEHCNCPFCQIAGAIHADLSKEHSEIDVAENTDEEEVQDADLNFESWKISQKGDCLYEVQNKLDSHESYNVFLGEPVGCTCGKSGCEHILAVLKS